MSISFVCYVQFSLTSLSDGSSFEIFVPFPSPAGRATHHLCFHARVEKGFSDSIRIDVTLSVGRSVGLLVNLVIITIDWFVGRSVNQSVHQWTSWLVGPLTGLLVGPSVGLSVGRTAISARNFF